MIPMVPGTKVYLACHPVSMRLGFDGLAARVAQVLDGDPFSGHLFLFRGKRADYLKVLYYDGTGLCLFAKRLESGKFVWPPIVDGKMVLTPAQLTLLIEAMDWRRTVAADVPRRPYPSAECRSLSQRDGPSSAPGDARYFLRSARSSLRLSMHERYARSGR